MARLEGESIYRVPAHFWVSPAFQAVWQQRWEAPCPMYASKSRALAAGYRLTPREALAFERRGYFRKTRSALYGLVATRDGERCGTGCMGACTLRLDHIVPLCWGGTNDVANLQLLCERCNSAKGGRLPLPPKGLG